MASCKSCGAEIGSAAFCPKCGAAQGAAAASGGGLSENVAAMLSYVLGWVTGLIFLFIDKRPFVKFHAAQSIVVFGALTLLRIGLLMMVGVSGSMAFGLWATVSGLLAPLGLVLWILLMVMAYQGKRFEIPLAASLARSISGT